MRQNYLCAHIDMLSFIRRLHHNPARLLLLAALIATACLCYDNLFLDFWNDEVYSLKQFQLVPLATTLSDYHDVNNHVGFNLLCNLYLRATHQHDLFALLMHPERIRIFLLFISLGITALLWRLSMEMGGVKLALINLVLFLTTLPFYNFTMQLRGYGLATLLVLGIVLYLHRFYHSGSRRHCLGICLLLAYVFYVHPANIYLIVALYPATAALAMLSPGWSTPQKVRFILSIYAAVTAGALLGILLYMPMWDLLFFNPLVGILKAFYWGFFKNALIYNTLGFIGARWIAFVAGIAGFVLYYRNRGGKVRTAEAFFWYFLLLYGGMYVVAFLHKDPMIVRVFAPGGVFLILGFGQCLYWLDEYAAPLYRKTIFIFVLASCLCTLPVEIYRRNRTIDRNNIAIERVENLTTNYYAHSLSLRRMVSMAQEHAAEKDFLLICLVNNSYEMQEYLKAARLPFYVHGQIDSAVAGRQSCWLITTNTNYFKALHPDWRLQKINKEFTYPNFYHVMVKPAADTTR